MGSQGHWLQKDVSAVSLAFGTGKGTESGSLSSRDPTVLMGEQEGHYKLDVWTGWIRPQWRGLGISCLDALAGLGGQQLGQVEFQGRQTSLGCSPLSEKGENSEPKH